MQHFGTYQTRISAYAGVERSDGDGALSAYGELYGRVQRRLFAEVSAVRPAGSLKREYLKRYEIPARLFNGVRVSLEGKVASIREQQKLRLDSLHRRIDRAEGQTDDATSMGGGIRSTRRNGGWPICGRGLQRWRLTLRRDGCGCASGRSGCGASSTALQRAATPATGSGSGTGVRPAADEFFVLGSRDETAGCHLCVASVADDGTLTLRLRMPDCLAP